MKVALPVIFLALLFLGSTYAAQTYEAELAGLVGTGLSGMLLYALLAVTGTIIAPLSSLPLVPIASVLWGPSAAAILTVLGWWVGGMIAFLLSRRFGRPLVEKMISVEKLAKVEARLPEKHQFWSIMVLSMVLPTDILSYSLGLFRNIPFRTYAPSVLIGNTPFAFVFAYTGALPFKQQVYLVVPVFLLVLLWRLATSRAASS